MTVRRFVAATCALTVVSAGATRASTAHADTADRCIAAAEQSQPLQREGKLRAARELLIGCSRPQCPSVVRADCTKWLADLDALMPSVVVRAVDATGADVLGVRVSVDGEPLSPIPEGREIEIDPGTHTLRFEHEGSAAVEQQVVLRESERHRILTVSFAPAASTEPTPEPPPAPAPTTEAPAISGRSLALPVALIGVGGAGLGVASYFWLAGLSDRATMASGCATTHACPQSQIDSARAKLVVGDLVGGTGIVATAIGVGLLVFGSSAAPSVTPVAIEPALGGACIDLRGRF
jgi:hypothetical protein